MKRIKLIITSCVLVIAVLLLNLSGYAFAESYAKGFLNYDVGISKLFKTKYHLDPYHEIHTLKITDLETLEPMDTKKACNDTKLKSTKDNKKIELNKESTIKNSTCKHKKLDSIISNPNTK